MGLWRVVEYERSTAHTIKVWRFENFHEAENFRREREGFYSMIGLDEEHGFTQATPEITKSEIDLFTRIVENPKLLDHIMRSFNL